MRLPKNPNTCDDNSDGGAVVHRHRRLSPAIDEMARNPNLLERPATRRLNFVSLEHRGDRPMTPKTGTFMRVPAHPVTVSTATGQGDRFSASIRRSNHPDEQGVSINCPTRSPTAGAWQADGPTARTSDRNLKWQALAAGTTRPCSTTVYSGKGLPAPRSSEELPLDPVVAGPKRPVAGKKLVTEAGRRLDGSYACCYQHAQ